MSDTTDITKMPLPGGNTNAPASGTYGEGAALERLKSALPGSPGSGPSAADPTAPMPTPGAGAGLPGVPPPGVPGAIMSPTQRPEVPVSTPLAIGPSAAPVAPAGRIRRLAALDALLQNPEVSESTREWAELVRGRLIEGSAQ